MRLIKDDAPLVNTTQQCVNSTETGQLAGPGPGPSRNWGPQSLPHGTNARGTAPQEC